MGTKHKASAPEVAILTGTERETARIHRPLREPADVRPNALRSGYQSADQAAAVPVVRAALKKG
jgi:hypothetical protein